MRKKRQSQQNSNSESQTGRLLSQRLGRNPRETVKTTVTEKNKKANSGEAQQRTENLLLHRQAGLKQHNASTTAHMAKTLEAYKSIRKPTKGVRVASFDNALFCPDGCQKLDMKSEVKKNGHGINLKITYPTVEQAMDVRRKLVLLRERKMAFNTNNQKKEWSKVRIGLVPSGKNLRVQFSWPNKSAAELPAAFASRALGSLPSINGKALTPQLVLNLYDYDALQRFRKKQRKNNKTSTLNGMLSVLKSKNDLARNQTERLVRHTVTKLIPTLIDIAKRIRQQESLNLENRIERRGIQSPRIVKFTYEKGGVAFYIDDGAQSRAYFPVVSKPKDASAYYKSKKEALSRLTTNSSMPRRIRLGKSLLSKLRSMTAARLFYTDMGMFGQVTGLVARLPKGDESVMHDIMDGKGDNRFTIYGKKIFFMQGAVKSREDGTKEFLEHLKASEIAGINVPNNIDAYTDLKNLIKGKNGFGPNGVATRWLKYEMQDYL